MSLDILKLAAQVVHANAEFQAQGTQSGSKISYALSQLQSENPDLLETKRLRSARSLTWMAASIPHNIKGRFPAPAAPPSYSVIGVDGSHVDTDRNMPVQCYLINIGICGITYGDRPAAQLENIPYLFTKEEDFRLGHPDFPMEAAPMDSTMIGLKRSLMELESTASWLEEYDASGPVLGLLDGTLIYWTLMSSDLHATARTHLINEQLLPQMNRIQELSKSRNIALASYISLPMAKDVINTLRVGQCPYDTANCGTYCRELHPGSRGCDSVDGLLDREIFGEYLQPFERSATYYSTSAVSTQYYGNHRVAFFYLHAGHEVARVEIPFWIAEDPEKLELVHSILVAQIAKGQGYPVSLSEAHEQAVIRTADRDTFQMLVRNSFQDIATRTIESQKQRSKRTRWI